MDVADLFGWQPEKCVGVMKLYIHEYPSQNSQCRNHTVDSRERHGQRTASTWPGEGQAAFQLRTLCPTCRDVRPWIWKHSGVKKLWVNIAVLLRVVWELHLCLRYSSPSLCLSPTITEFQPSGEISKRVNFVNKKVFASSLCRNTLERILL